MCKNVGVINNAVAKNKHIARGRALGVSWNRKQPVLGRHGRGDGLSGSGRLGNLRHSCHTVCCPR